MDGSFPAPTKPKKRSSWESKDVRIISWLLSSIESHMVNNLRSFTTAKEMWDYLRQIYYQDNSARVILQILLLYTFLPLMIYPIKLTVLIHVLYISNVVHSLSLSLPRFQILCYKSPVDLLEFHDHRIGIGSHIVLFKPLLIKLLCLSLILRILLKNVGERLV